MESDPKMVETAVMVCPQCEGEGGYADGLDEAACHTECPRCKSNGWIVDLTAITPALQAREAAAERRGMERAAVMADAMRHNLMCLMLLGFTVAMWAGIMEWKLAKENMRCLTPPPA